jgi:hypothetical protein
MAQSLLLIDKLCHSQGSHIVIIQQSTAMLATTMASYLSAKRQTVAPFAEKTADTTTISQAAQDRLSFEKASGLQVPDELVGFLQDRGFFSAEKTSEPSVHSTSPYRVEGPVYTLKEMAEIKGVPLLAYKMTDAQASELKLREQQEVAREIVNFNYAKAHQYQPVGQVLVNREVFATVFDAGSFEMAHALPGLSNTPLNPADRLADIARAVKGEIVTSDLLPTLGGWSGPGAPESMLPPLTARSLQEIMEEEIRPAMEKERQAWEELTGKKLPRPT